MFCYSFLGEGAGARALERGSQGPVGLVGAGPVQRALWTWLTGGPADEHPWADGRMDSPNSLPQLQEGIESVGQGAAQRFQRPLQ